MNGRTKLSRGRRQGSTKGQIELAEKLRKKGQTNEQIAATLGVSPRTVTRYLNPASKNKLSLMRTIRSLPADEWIRLFKLLRYDYSNQENGVWLFILRYLDHPQWKMFWGSVTADDILQAIAIRRHFESFKLGCNSKFGDFMDLMAASYNCEDFDEIKALWDVPEQPVQEEPF